jgi:uncharacterized membrane protein YcaP (DUF421 family)
MSVPDALIASASLVTIEKLLETAAWAVLIYAGGFILIRIGKNRLLGRSTPFDIVLGIVLGSLLSRAINGAATVPVTIAAAAALIGSQTGISWLACWAQWIERVVKGRPSVLLRDGAFEATNMRRADISAGDLNEALRLHAGTVEPAAVSQALLERNGDIIVVKANRGHPQVTEIDVADGVQTVRVEFG